ncbi:hypothetical protein [Sphingomonas bacterium]|uniref:hypothetical protein n=1 Tax=Sphingomonas bacterium TaxID=1895847 RepID=UPI001576F245|nr:hypothetical protein [Sphingomonas bacterium]
MEIVKLPVGEPAPKDSDCIGIEEQADGRFTYTGSLLAGEESIAIVDPVLCPTREAAEEQGTSWAAGCDVQRLYVSTTLLG